MNKEIRLIEELTRYLNGKIESLSILPDGSGSAVVSYPLPLDHWIYETNEYGFCGEPPMPMRMGTSNPEREKMAKMLRKAGKYAVKVATNCGKDMDFDPDALVNCLIVGLLGYYTEDGLSHIEED